MRRTRPSSPSTTTLPVGCLGGRLPGLRRRALGARQARRRAPCVDRRDRREVTSSDGQRCGHRSATPTRSMIRGRLRGQARRGHATSVAAPRHPRRASHDGKLELRESWRSDTPVRCRARHRARDRSSASTRPPASRSARSPSTGVAGPRPHGMGATSSSSGRPGSTLGAVDPTVTTPASSRSYRLASSVTSGNETEAEAGLGDACATR